jgi:phospholipid/cholesterol/gamma-HCH transport system substrate-binding protein
MTAIRKHSGDAIAVVLLLVAALVVGGFILSQQRLSVPGWVPFFGQDFFTLRGDFATAQAVTPGQGQTVNVAGVKVGEISDVTLKDGRARVTMRIKPKYSAIYHDATMLLRPKTGLKDMIVELSPGSPSTGRLRSGASVPIQSTLPDVNPDEILAALDTDTRAYLRLLLGGAGQGLRSNAPNLSATLRRFEPTARDVARITQSLAVRRANLRRVIHNFQLLTTELSTKDAALSGVVQSSNAVFQRLANQSASIRAALRLAPGTLRETDAGLAKVDRLARALGPSLQALRPTARALAPTLVQVRPFLRQTTPIIRSKVRPFTRAALPTVKALRPAASDLAALTPDLLTTFQVLNYALNELAYNPPGSEEGFLFWNAWVNHIANSVFATQDAHGPIRHGLFIASCNALSLLPGAASGSQSFSTLIQLLNLPNPSSFCPSSAGP